MEHMTVWRDILDMIEHQSLKMFGWIVVLWMKNIFIQTKTTQVPKQINQGVHAYVVL